MSRSGRRRRITALGVSVVTAAGLFPLVAPFTAHAGEAVVLVMPPVLGSLLWLGWPKVRRIRWTQYATYLAVVLAALVAAMLFVAYVARGRILWVEVFWALYFVIAWRFAWALWKRIAGRLWERDRRWGRATRRSAGGLRNICPPRRRARAAVCLLIRPTRLGLVCSVFAPLFVGSLIHRVKIGNPTDLGPYADWPLEPVTFETRDGLTLSGWFLPESQSDSTVVICHGLGANKGNFIDFLSVFRAQGYNALIFDFRGHGGSEGHTSTFGLFESADVRAAVDWLKGEKPNRARHVFGLGSSMGAVALVRAAAEDERIEAVVLDSAFVSARLLAEQHCGRSPPARAVTNIGLAAMSLHAGRSMWGLDAGAAIARLSPRPVMLVHGKDDSLIPPENLAILYALAGEPKRQWLGPGPHSNIMTTDFFEYQRRVIEFFDTARHGRQHVQRELGGE